MTDINKLAESVKLLNSVVDKMREDLYGNPERKMPGLLAKQERDDMLVNEYILEIRSLHDKIEDISQQLRRDVDSKFDLLIHQIADVSVWKANIQGTPMRIVKIVGVISAFLIGVATIINFGWALIKKILNLINL